MRVRTLHGGLTGTVLARYEIRHVGQGHIVAQPEYEIRFDAGYTSRLSVDAVEVI